MTATKKFKAKKLAKEQAQFIAWARTRTTFGHTNGGALVGRCLVKL